MDSRTEGLLLNSKQVEIMNEYCGNGGSKLDQICKRLVHKKNVPLYLEDDLYSLAQWTFLESLQSYDDSKNIKFSTYLVNSIWKAFYDWTRDNMRGKRCNLQTDKDGKIMRDERNNPMVIQDISLEAKVDDDFAWAERVASDFNLEKEITYDNNDNWHEEVRNYLKSLSPLQRKIAILLSENYNQDEICEELGITKLHYNNSLKRIMSSEKIRALRALVEG